MRDVKVQIGAHKAVLVWRGDGLRYNGRLKESVAGQRGTTYTCKVTVKGVTHLQGQDEQRRAPVIRAIVGGMTARFVL